MTGTLKGLPWFYYCNSQATHLLGGGSTLMKKLASSANDNSTLFSNTYLKRYDKSLKYPCVETFHWKLSSDLIKL